MLIGTELSGSLDAHMEERLTRAIARCERLPVLDRALQRALAVADREEASFGELVEVLEGDPNLCANILRFVNSAANARRFSAKTVRQAVAMVGRDGVRRLALESATCRFFERAPGNGRLSRGQMHLHAIQVARLSVACAARADVPGDHVHLAGLLHDCGRVVMPLAFPEDTVDAISLAEERGFVRARAERDILGADHAEAGALFARSSGVSEQVVTAIALHHGGADGAHSPDAVSACVQLGNILANVLTGADMDEDLKNAALRALGQSDALVDELAEEELALVGAAPRQAASVRVRDMERLERLATTDDLTGIASRRHWTSLVRGRIESGERGSVLVCDLDHFKEVNDRHGHAVGDRVLAEVAEVLAASGLAGRLGGDEFGVWTPGEPRTALEVAHALVEEVATSMSLLDTKVRAGISIGVCSLADERLSLSALLETADRALYEAKREGRGRVGVAGPA
jgi:diguanylate cyclase (GGDEF)-like protein/putative nucleotidyltransferase with HDIG domain